MDCVASVKYKGSEVAGEMVKGRKRKKKKKEEIPLRLGKKWFRG